MKALRVAFDRKSIMVPIADLVPTKPVGASLRSRMIYKRIAASIAEVGLVEPLMIFRPTIVRESISFGTAICDWTF
jgi:hypothetical protein